MKEKLLYHLVVYKEGSTTKVESIYLVTEKMKEKSKKSLVVKKLFVALQLLELAKPLNDAQMSGSFFYI